MITEHFNLLTDTWKGDTLKNNTELFLLTIQF